MANLDVILNKISGLLNVAEDPATPPEAAATYRAKAEELMRKYRIEQEQLLAQDATAVEPILSIIDLCRLNTTRYSSWYSIFIRRIAGHCGVQVHIKNYFHPVDGWMSQAALVGYEGDVRYAEYLFNAARLVFINRVDVNPDPSLSDAVNVFRLRSAGWNRYEIADALWGNRDATHTTRATKMYRAECERRGVEEMVAGRGVNVKTFRYGFANGFSNGLQSQLREARDGADSLGGAVQLHGREERVEEAFYGFFPTLRPKQEEVAVKETSPAKKSRKSGWTKADEARWQRYNYSAEARAGAALGRDAAREVEVDRSSRAQRVEEAGTRTPSGEITS
jgi:hypothetical protein